MVQQKACFQTAENYFRCPNTRTHYSDTQYFEHNIMCRYYDPPSRDKHRSLPVCFSRRRCEISGFSSAPCLPTASSFVNPIGASSSNWAAAAVLSNGSFRRQRVALEVEQRNSMKPHDCTTHNSLEILLTF